MNICVPSSVILQVLLGFCLVFYFIEVSSIHTEEGLELLFRQRSQMDWEDVWHRETLSRCREKLVRQIYWACEKDIYRLVRRSSLKPGEYRKKRSITMPQLAGDTHNMSSSHPWLEQSLAKRLLRSRGLRSSPSSITNECCTKVGCTWEEYAEYCPSNKRKNHY